MRNTSNYDEINDGVKELFDAALDMSELRLGETSYPYAFGWYTSTMVDVIADLNLSKQQLKIFNDRIERHIQMTKK